MRQTLCLAVALFIPFRSATAQRTPRGDTLLTINRSTDDREVRLRADSSSAEWLKSVVLDCERGESRSGTIEFSLFPAPGSFERNMFPWFPADSVVFGPPVDQGHSIDSGFYSLVIQVGDEPPSETRRWDRVFRPAETIYFPFTILPPWLDHILGRPGQTDLVRITSRISWGRPRADAEVRVETDRFTFTPARKAAFLRATRACGLPRPARQ